MTDARPGRGDPAGDAYAGFDHHSAHHREGAECEWARMRDRAGLPRSEKYGGFYVVTRHADLRTAAAQHKIYSSAQGIALPSEDRTRHIPAEVDPPLQREYRRLLDPFLTQEAVARQETQLRRIALELLDQFAGETRIDAVARFTEPFPVLAALTMFGFPREDASRLRGLVDGLIHGRGTDLGRRSHLELTQYLEALLTGRIAAGYSPGEDVIAAIASGSVEGRLLSLDDQVSITRLLLFGGFTTVNLALSSALLQLAQRPELADRLHADPGLMPVAAEEFVRFASPGTYLRRTVTTDTSLGGQALHPGDQVLLCFGAANRDPAVFASPEEIVLDRNPNPHVGFGFGAHRCMGSAVAKLEIKVALEEILRRYGRIECDPTQSAVWNSGETQGLASLPLILHSRTT